jgi:hypothetical protein
MATRRSEPNQPQLDGRTVFDAFAHGYGAALDLTGSLFLSHPGRFFQSPARAYRRATRLDWARAIRRAMTRHADGR